MSQSLELTLAQRNIATLLRHGGVITSIQAAAAGKESVRWGYRPSRHQLSVVLASGGKTFTSAGASHLDVRLTTARHKPLAKAKHLKLIAVGSFTPKHGKTVTVRRAITVAR